MHCIVRVAYIRRQLYLAGIIAGWYSWGNINASSGHARIVDSAKGQRGHHRLRQTKVGWKFIMVQTSSINIV